MSTYQDNYRPGDYRYQPIDQAENLANKQQIITTMQDLAGCPPAELAEAVNASYHSDARVHVTHPVNELDGHDAIGAKLWQPLRNAMPDVERHDSIVAGGCYGDRYWVGCTGHFVGTFEQDWLDIPATGEVIAVRYAEGHRLRDGKIAASYVFIDFLDLMRQVGYWPLAPSLGREMHWLPPATCDGVILTPQANALSQRSIERVLRMHAALGRYSGRAPTRAVLDEMAMVEHWHPNFMWYGPAGIGATRGLRAFTEHHQIPFLVAFPDRQGSEIGHFIRIGDGYFAVTGGWGYLRATHLGSGFLGIPATGKRIAMRVMDFYRCDDETIVENWVPMDIPHLLLQVGVDVFGRMRHQFRQHRPASVSSWLVAKETEPSDEA